MYSDQLYANGVHSVLRVQWLLHCVTPLAVRNGQAVTYTESNAQPKTRGQGLRLEWALKADEGYQVSALHFGYRIADGALEQYHYMPPSSIRGALRSWTIRQLVEPQFHDVAMPAPKPEDAPSQADDYPGHLRAALASRSTGYELIASLFGIASDSREAENLPSNAGRLRVVTEPFDRANAGAVDAGGVRMPASSGPVNVDRQMSVRNPLDRFTHASKEEGLHRFLEFCSGTSIRVRMTVANPLPEDVGLLSLWVSEIDIGLLRFGALSSIGRGRVEVGHGSDRA